MATIIKTMFGNNERREGNAVTATLPFLIEPEDIREGLSAVEMTSAEVYTVATIPNNVLVTGLYLVVDNPLDSVTSAAFAVALGATTLIAAGNGKAVGVVQTDLAFVPTLITGGAVDITVTPTLVGATTKGDVKVVVEYLDYARSTKSYLY